MNERSYTSPLREAQARQTRNAILDALTQLLAAQPADQISTREIAERAGVSQPTVYRYFPDRQALLDGLADHVDALAGSDSAVPGTLDELVAYTNEFFAAAAPDGETLAISARGIASSQWWRRGHSHIDQSEVWLVRIGATPTYERVTDGEGKELWPMWGADGRTLYYVSDRDGAENVWVRAPEGAPRALTRFRDGRVLWPSISRDGRTIAFIAEDESAKPKTKPPVVVDEDHHFARLWIIDVASREIKPLIRGERHVMAFDWSFDGARIVFTSRATPKLVDNDTTEVFVIPTGFRTAPYAATQWKQITKGGGAKSQPRSAGLVALVGRSRSIASWVRSPTYATQAWTTKQASRSKR